MNRSDACPQARSTLDTADGSGPGWKGRVVTGSSRGIGRAIALSLAAEGCRVVLSARGAADLDAALAQVRTRARAGAEDNARGVVGDLSTPAGAAAVVDAAVDGYGRLDIVVNNVGGSGARDLAGADAADFRAILDRNLFPALMVSRAAQPHLEVQGGVIVMITSIYGREAGGGPATTPPRRRRSAWPRRWPGSWRRANPGAEHRPRVGLVPGRRMGAPAAGRPEGIAAFVAGTSPGAGSGGSRRSLTW